MNDREKALATLRAAREALIDHIAQVIVDREDFTSEIVDGWSTATEEILDLGERLRRLTQVIDGMPPARVEPTKYQPATYGDYTGPASAGVTTLPTWDDFLHEINVHLFNNATHTLVSLSGMDSVIAREAVNIFNAQWDDPEFKAKAKSLRAQLRTGFTGSVILIQELFGVNEDIATRAYHSLRVAV